MNSAEAYVHAFIHNYVKNVYELFLLHMFAFMYCYEQSAFENSEMLSIEFKLVIKFNKLYITRHYANNSLKPE